MFPNAHIFICFQILDTLLKSLKEINIKSGKKRAKNSDKESSVSHNNSIDLFNDVPLTLSLLSGSSMLSPISHPSQHTSKSGDEIK